MHLYLFKLTLYLFIGMLALKSSYMLPLVEDFCLILAKIVAGSLSIFDAGIERSGNTIIRYTYGYAVTISKECSALEFVLSLTAALLACPGSVVKRIWAIITVSFVFQLINLTRLMSLIYANVFFNRHYFDIFHEQFWIFLLSIFAVGFFLVWARYFKLFPQKYSN